MSDGLLPKDLLEYVERAPDIRARIEHFLEERPMRQSSRPQALLGTEAAIPGQAMPVQDLRALYSEVSMMQQQQRMAYERSVMEEIERRNRMAQMASLPSTGSIGAAVGGALGDLAGIRW